MDSGRAVKAVSTAKRRIERRRSQSRCTQCPAALA